jgi:hypothetical protein
MNASNVQKLFINAKRTNQEMKNEKYVTVYITMFEMGRVRIIKARAIINGDISKQPE